MLNLRSQAVFLLMALVWTLVLTGQSRAADWVVQTAASEIQFEYLGDGVPKTGVFGQFNGFGSFNAADPATARFTLSIETSSIDLYDTLASGFAQSAEWFDSKNFPEVTYRLMWLSPLEGMTYVARGQLTIRGEERPITSRIELEIGKETALARGELVIVRDDYLLGVGPSAAFVEIGPDVKVRFNLQAVRTE